MNSSSQSALDISNQSGRRAELAIGRFRACPNTSFGTPPRGRWKPRLATVLMTQHDLTGWGNCVPARATSTARVFNRTMENRSRSDADGYGMHASGFTLNVPTQLTPVASRFNLGRVNAYAM
jgi:hypothetical protein